MAKCCPICNCIDPILIALACAEAAEHNAVVGKECSQIGERVKRLVSSDEYDELVFEHDWLAYPVIEPLAELAFNVCANDISEKCAIPTAEIKKLFNEAIKDNGERRFGSAQQKLIVVKSQLLEMAKNLCKNEVDISS